MHLKIDQRNFIEKSVACTCEQNYSYKYCALGQVTAPPEGTVSCFKISYIKSRSAFYNSLQKFAIFVFNVRCKHTFQTYVGLKCIWNEWQLSVNSSIFVFSIFFSICTHVISVICHVKSDMWHDRSDVKLIHKSYQNTSPALSPAIYNDISDV